ncbi:MAG TPA: FtsX-like permease family protein [Atopostipes sp.]|nr:FtsX-like permease family protein [Atopostipes sp.]
MKLAFSIAIRFLKSSKGQTLLILIGIAIGVAVQVFIGSLITGLQASLVDTTIGSSSQVTIVSDENENYFEDNEEVFNELADDSRFSVVSKTFDGNGFVLDGDEETLPMLFRGFEMDAANGIYNFDTSLVEGSLPDEENEIILGTVFAEEQAIEIGDTVEFLIPPNDMTELEVVGVFDLGVASLNESWLVAELETVQQIFEEEGQLSAIETQIDEVFESDVIAKDIGEELATYGLTTSNWQEENEQLLSGLSGQSISSYMIQVFVLIAVLLGIASVLAISAVQKSKQLGILKAMGIKDRTAGWIFLSQGFLLGTAGAILGAAAGVGLMYAFSVFVKNPDGTSLVPFYADWLFIGGSVLIAIIASTFAAFIPAKNSSRLNPIEVIQNG